jgi:hypothetical protein
MHFTRTLLAVAIAGVFSGHAMAQTFTTNPGDLGAVQRLDFGGAGLDALGVTVGSAGVASYSVGPFTISNSGTAVVLGEGGTTLLGDNGLWRAGSAWDNAGTGPAIGAFVDGNLSGDNSVTFALPSGFTTSAIGLHWMSDATTGLPRGTLQLEVFDAAGVSLGSIGPGSAPGGAPLGEDYVNGRTFQGFYSATPQIASFRVAGDYHVYGDVVFAQPIPEPSEIAFMLAGLAAAGAAARRRRARAGVAA